MNTQPADMPGNMLGSRNASPMDAPALRLAPVSEVVPRFEFRIFGQDLNSVEQRIRKVALCESLIESREIYILDGKNCDRNVKIRGGKLELKCLIERDRGLERWKPAGAWAFPVERRAIPGRLFSVAALERTSSFPVSLTEKVSEKEFLHHIAHISPCDPPLYRANVFKRRSRFTLQGCPVEIDRVRVNGAAIESIAIESQQAGQVLAVRSALGLEEFENIAYPLAIARILGIRPLPDAEDYE